MKLRRHCLGKILELGGWMSLMEQGVVGSPGLVHLEGHSKLVGSARLVGVQLVGVQLSAAVIKGVLIGRYASRRLTELHRLQAASSLDLIVRQPVSPTRLVTALTDQLSRQPVIPGNEAYPCISRDYYGVVADYEPAMHQPAHKLTMNKPNAHH